MNLMRMRHRAIVDNDDALSLKDDESVRFTKTKISLSSSHNPAKVLFLLGAKASHFIYGIPALISAERSESMNFMLGTLG